MLQWMELYCLKYHQWLKLWILLRFSLIEDERETLWLAQKKKRGRREKSSFWASKISGMLATKLYSRLALAGISLTLLGAEKKRRKAQVETRVKWAVTVWQNISLSCSLVCELTNQLSFRKCIQHSIYDGWNLRLSMFV